MEVAVERLGMTPASVRESLSGLPEPGDYGLRVIPLRYREKPHLSAWTEFEDRQITIQIPQPFLPFGEVVPYGAKRRAGKGMSFVWLTEGITFSTTDEVLRFLYLHEWMHWFLKEELGRKSRAETTCDRFALRNYLKLQVSLDDARAALRRSA
jgi:hypothetical protein